MLPEKNENKSTKGGHGVGRPIEESKLECLHKIIIRLQSSLSLAKK